MECLRLIASSRFAEKRIGYLGLTQFMDEDADILMLVTNSIKKDLQHPVQRAFFLFLFYPFTLLFAALESIREWLGANCVSQHWIL